MTQTSPIYRSINNPLTIWGVERRLFALPHVALSSGFGACIYVRPRQVSTTIAKEILICE
jgi:hypothetical protein